MNLSLMKRRPPSVGGGVDEGVAASPRVSEEEPKKARRGRQPPSVGGGVDTPPSFQVDGLPCMRSRNRRAFSSVPIAVVDVEPRKMSRVGRRRS